MIGKGAFGHVYETSVSGKADRFAIKIIDRLLVSNLEAVKRVRNEVNIHSTLNHQNILSLLHHFEDKGAVYLVMELCEEGELLKYQRLQPNCRLDEAVARSLFRDICLGLQYLHSRAIIHRDLKLSNILLKRRDNRLEAKIGDFGLACVVPSSVSESLEMTICGTPNYLAPEVVTKRPYGREADLWSLGCLLYSMVVGKAPFEGRDLKSTFARVSLGEFHVPEHVSAACKDVIEGLVRKDADSRLPIAEILKHPLLNQRSIPLLPGPNLSELICTKWLKPLRQTIKHGVIEILANGQVSFTVDSDRSTMTVTRDGHSVTFADANGRSESCRYNELGKAAQRRYDYMRRFVDLVRSKTPLIVLKRDDFKMTLMASQQEVVLVGDKINIAFNGVTDVLTVSTGHSRQYYHPTYRKADMVDDPVHRRWLVEFLSRLEQLKRVKERLADADDSVFPFIIDETESSRSPLKMSSVISNVRSFDTDTLASVHALKGSPTGSVNAKFLPNVGWCLQQSAESFLLLFNDGAMLHVDGRNRLVKEADGRWMPIDQSLPLLVRSRLQHVPSFI